MLESLPVNSNEPMFIAAECLKDTLLEIGLGEDSAETARRAFLTLKKGSEEETLNKIRRIASKLSVKSSPKSSSAQNAAAGYSPALGGTDKRLHSLNQDQLVQEVH